MFTIKFISLSSGSFLLPLNNYASSSLKCRLKTFGFFFPKIRIDMLKTTIRLNHMSSYVKLALDS